MARICIVAHFAFGAMKGGDGHSGGVERQTSIVARWLSERGHKVSMVTWDDGQEDGSFIDGVRMLKLCRRNDGLPGLRFFYPRWTSLNQALRRADAELYYQNCGEYVTGQIAWWCRRHGRRFVYSVASDPDCDPRLPEMRTFRERILYRYGLRHADPDCRSDPQAAAHAERRLRAGRPPPPHAVPGPQRNRIQHSPQATRSKPFRVAWVGRIAPVKRLEVLLDVAEGLPDVRFDVAGQSDAARELHSRRCLREPGPCGT